MPDSGDERHVSYVPYAVLTTSAEMRQVRTILLHIIFVFAAIVAVLGLRSASLIWIHGVMEMETDPWRALQSGLRFAFFVASIQTPILLLGLLVCTWRRGDERLRCAVVATFLLCVLDLFVRPVVLWSDYSNVVGFSMLLGLPPLAMGVSRWVVVRRRMARQA